MSDLTDLTPAGVTIPAAELREAVILDDATALGQEVRCIVPSESEQLASDPMPWEPYTTATGEYWPKRGDRAQIAFPPDGPPAIHWWQPNAAEPDAVAVIDIRSYGAKGDGETDDTEAIQEALEEASAGAVVYLPPGTYVVGETLVLKSKVHLRGSGVAATTLKLGAEADTNVLESADFGEGGTQNFSIRDLSIDGNASENTEGSGLVLDGVSFLLDWVFVHDCAEDGIVERKSEPDGELRAYGEMDAFMRHCKIWDCGRFGVDWDGHDCHFTDVVCISNTQINFLLNTNADAAKCNAVHVYGAAEYGLVYRSFANKFDLCEAEGATKANVLIEGDGSIWLGPEVFADSGGAGKVGFEWASGKGFNTIIVGGSARGTTEGALKFTGSGDNSRVIGFITNMETGKAVVGGPGEVELDVAAINGCELGVLPAKAFSATYVGTGSTGVTDVAVLENKWEAGDPVRYWREGNTVHLEGKIEGGEAGTVFTLPEGFRPDNDIEFGTPGNVIVTVETSGAVKRGGTAAAGLTGFSFRAAATTAKPSAANVYEYIRVTIPRRATLTGIRYRVGDSSSGNVRVGIYDGNGGLLRGSASTEQGAARTVQSVPLLSDLTLGPGDYFLLIQFSSADASVERSRALANSGAAVGVNFETIPAEISPPSAPENVDRPILVTY